MLRPIDWQKFTKNLTEPTASIFRKGKISFLHFVNINLTRLFLQMLLETLLMLKGYLKVFDRRERLYMCWPLISDASLLISGIEDPPAHAQ